jgi:phosphatidylethanolamine-binding protein (PEBP) family uncharacterized protein
MVNNEEEFYLKKLFLILCIMIIASCVGCGSSNSKYNSFIDEYSSFEVTSTNLNNGVWDDIISSTDKGSNKSPQLKWDAVEGADQYVIIMDDVDAWDLIHWKLDNVTETVET